MSFLRLQFILYTFHWTSFVFSPLVCTKLIVLGESTLVVPNVSMAREGAFHLNPNLLPSSQPKCESGT